MRWSLILSAFVAVLSMQSLLSFALVTTQNEGMLEKRVLGLGKGKSKDVKASSSTYRRNSFSHPYAYDFSGPSGVTRQSVPDGQRQSFFSKMFKKKKYDADHVYEAQMYHNTLRQQGTSHDQLPPQLQGEARRIMNRPENMAPIPPDVNRRKGQWVKQGLKGKSPSTSHGLTRSYSLNSYPSARDTAQQLQQTFQQHGYGRQGPTFHDTLHNSMTHAGVLQPGQPSPPGSPRHSRSTRQSSRQRTSSQAAYQAPFQPVIPVIPHRSQSTSQGPTRQSARLRGQSFSSNQPVYQQQSSHGSTSYLPQTGPVIPQRSSSRAGSSRRRY